MFVYANEPLMPHRRDPIIRTNILPESRTFAHRDFFPYQHHHFDVLGLFLIFSSSSRCSHPVDGFLCRVFSQKCRSTFKNDSSCFTLFHFFFSPITNVLLTLWGIECPWITHFMEWQWKIQIVGHQRDTDRYRKLGLILGIQRREYHLLQL